MTMAVRMQDLTKQPERCVFNGSPPEEINYAESFWQSVRLQPTMESRLVSSDIKQRLGTKKITSKSSEGSGPNDKGKAVNKLNEFFMKARALDQIAEFNRLRTLAEMRLKDREALHQRRQERIKKEEISRDKIKKVMTLEEMEEAKKEHKRKIGEAYSIQQMIQEIDEFEKRKEVEMAAQTQGVRSINQSKNSTSTEIDESSNALDSEK
ncbi:hypothetical protein EGW08_013384 [Elysia chlorotica]|uniref:Cilia- and flagella-associated protein HOATZ n=1 Tax=Elysia chlorotica TaxID=188477 RepID=A0A433TB74_ELYCH|nr:hypothetical protein EGW08_013384 [Elysia chlorotica]